MFIFPALDPSSTEFVEEGDYEEYQEEDQGQVADQGKPSNIDTCPILCFTHAYATLFSSCIFSLF